MEIWRHEFRRYLPGLLHATAYGISSPCHAYASAKTCPGLKQEPHRTDGVRNNIKLDKNSCFWTADYTPMMNQRGAHTDMSMRIPQQWLGWEGSLAHYAGEPRPRTHLSAHYNTIIEQSGKAKKLASGLVAFAHRLYVLLLNQRQKATRK